MFFFCYICELVTTFVLENIDDNTFKYGYDDDLFTRDIASNATLQGAGFKYLTIKKYAMNRKSN